MFIVKIHCATAAPTTSLTTSLTLTIFFFARCSIFAFQAVGTRALISAVIFLFFIPFFLTDPNVSQKVPFVQQLFFQFVFPQGSVCDTFYRRAIIMKKTDVPKKGD